MKIIWFLYLFLTASSLVAQPVLKGCHTLPLRGEAVTLDFKKNTLLFLKNKTHTDLWMTLASKAKEPDAAWTSRIQTSHWSALTVGNTVVTLNCIESRPGHEQQIPCENAVTVCRYKHAKIPANAQDVYWAGEDMALSALIAAISAQGFKLPAAGVS